MLLMTAALVAALGMTPAQAQTRGGGGDARPMRAPDTDETVTVTRGTRLAVNAFSGEVLVRSWGRDAVRVQARHSSRTRVTIHPSGSLVAVSASGSPGSVDYEINVPAWMPVKVEGTYIYISVEGSQADVAAETVRGDISIKGGASLVTAKSIEGEVILEAPRGRINASSVNQGITITGGNGEFVVETTNGHISLTNMESASVDAATINGNIKYDGTVAPSGKFRFSTHNGNIVVAVPEATSAGFTVRTYNGSLNTNLPLKTAGEIRRGQRATYTLGSGSADFELESFGGTIQLRKRGSDQPLQKLKDKDLDE
jgi:Putative adhesin